ncbi:hypothetical protein EJB05_34436, partial [Eragrostis curvula]
MVEEEEKKKKEKEEEEDDEEYCPGLEPLFFDEAEAVADHERQKQREHAKELHRQRKKAHWETKQRIYDYDPKQGRCIFTPTPLRRRPQHLRPRRGV